MVNAIEALFFNKIAEEAPETEDFDDDIKLGQKYRAFIQAKNIIKKTITEVRAMKEYKRDKPTKRREL